MGWIALALLAVAPIVVLALKIDQAHKAMNRLKVQLRFAEQQSMQVEQLAFWLAEEQSQQLLVRLQQWTRQFAKLPPYAPHLELMYRAIPTLCREQANKGTLPKQSLAQFLKKQTELGMNEMENLFRQYPVMTELWQSNTLTSYLKLCHKALEILQEQQAKGQERLVG